jgi:acetolactate synthase-1/2/3 large subunit
VAIQAGPNAFAAALRPVKGGWADWRAAARADYLASLELVPLPSPVDMGAVSAHLRAVLPADAIITNGAGNFAVWPNKFLQYGPHSRLLAPQSGAMGYGVPAAIAAKLAYPDRRVLCFAGDGDFQMTAQELATARQHGAMPVILILNNGIYGTIRAHQEREYPARVLGTDMVNPDFVMLAQAHGFHAERVESTAAFAAAFDRALASPTGAVLDLAISAEALTPRASLSAIRGAAQRRLEQEDLSPSR